MSNNGIKRYASQQYVDDAVKNIKQNIYTSDLCEVINSTETVVLIEGQDVVVGDIIEVYIEYGKGAHIEIEAPPGFPSLVLDYPINTRPEVYSIKVSDGTQYIIHNSGADIKIIKAKSNLTLQKELAEAIKDHKDDINELNAKYDEICENISIFNGIYLRDIENGLTYLVQMKGGTLVSSSRTVSIQVSKEPDKMIYNAGEAFDPTGMIVSTTCEDGTQKIITNYTCSDIVDGVVIITYIESGTEYTASVNVTVKSIEDMLIDFEYTTNADGTYTLNTWKGTLNGEPSTEMVFPDLESIIM